MYSDSYKFSEILHVIENVLSNTNGGCIKSNLEELLEVRDLSSNLWSLIVESGFDKGRIYEGIQFISLDPEITIIYTCKKKLKKNYWSKYSYPSVIKII